MKPKRLVVIPSDPIRSYESAGYDWLERYYNPQKMFEDVFAFSPLEDEKRFAYGMTIQNVPAVRMKQVLQELKPDVVRAYGGYWPADVACLSRIEGVPLIISVHDTNPALFHRSVLCADIVICMSQAVANLAMARGVAPERIRVLPNRVDLEVFKPVTDAGALQDIASRFPPGKYILHVGRKSKQKNLETLIHSLTLLPNEYSCVFVGRGEYEEYENIAKSLGVEQRCFWIESIKNSELPLWYSWCDCMCTPSRWEGFGIVFIEAAACGAAIVTSDIPPMCEYLTHEESAHLVADYENPNELARAIQRVCENESYRQKIKAGAQRATLPFERNRVDAAEAQIYQEAIELPAPSPERMREIRSLCKNEHIKAVLKASLPGRGLRAGLRLLRSR